MIIIFFQNGFGLFLQLSFQRQFKLSDTCISPLSYVPPHQVIVLPNSFRLPESWHAVGGVAGLSRGPLVQYDLQFILASQVKPNQHSTAMTTTPSNIKKGIIELKEVDTSSGKGCRSRLHVAVVFMAWAC